PLQLGRLSRLGPARVSGLDRRPGDVLRRAGGAARDEAHPVEAGMARRARTHGARLRLLGAPRAPRHRPRRRPGLDEGVRRRPRDDLPPRPPRPIPRRRTRTVAAPERRVLVIGAGPAGLSCGYRLAQAGTPVAVYEASPFVGGLCRSLDLWGRRVDLGPHRFFSTSPMVNAFWKEIVGPDHTLVDRLTRIYYGGR